MTVAIDYIDAIRRLMLRPCARFRGVCICYGCACVLLYYRCAANITIGSGYIVYVRGVCVCVCVRARVCVCTCVCVCCETLDVAPLRTVSQSLIFFNVCTTHIICASDYKYFCEQLYKQRQRMCE